MPHALVEEQRSLDFRGLYYGGMLRPGEKHSWRWDDGVGVAFLTLEEPDGSWRVRYVHTADPERKARELRIVWVPIHYGGRRPLVLCPSCGKRRGVLYLWRRTGGFYCRTCSRLAYRSQQLRPADRYHYEAGKVALRLGLGNGSWFGAWDEAMSAEPDIPKPKWMRWPTYERLAGAFWQYEHARQVAIITPGLLRRLQP